MIDVVVVKVYPVYFTEFDKAKAFKKSRCQQSVDFLNDKQQSALENKVQELVDQNKKLKPEVLAEKV